MTEKEEFAVRLLLWCPVDRVPLRFELRGWVTVLECPVCGAEMHQEAFAVRRGEAMARAERVRTRRLRRWNG